MQHINNFNNFTSLIKINANNLIQIWCINLPIETKKNNVNILLKNDKTNRNQSIDLNVFQVDVIVIAEILNEI